MRRLIYPVVIVFIITLMLSFKVSDDPNSNDRGLPNQIAIIDGKKMDGNNISTWYTNTGSFNRDPVTGNAGFEWPKGSRIFPRYASGLWLGAKVGDDTLLAIAEYDYEYLPGYIDENGFPQGKNDPNFKIYRIQKGDSLNADYIQWPLSQGAYFDSTNKPLLLGYQTMFYSYTDGYAEAHGNNAGSTAPLNAQILQTNWCYNEIGALENSIFMEYRIINKGSIKWDSAIISVWSDDTNYPNRINGCDSALNLAYCYYGNSNNPEYLIPPATGYVMLKGPEVYTGNQDDTVSYYSVSKNRVVTKTGYKELRFSSFNTVVNADPTNGDPTNYRQAYGYMQGIPRSGIPWINPLNNTVTKFPYSGDPESGTGWVNPYAGNVRYIMNFHFFSLEPGDTQIVLIAQSVGQGINRLNSVTQLKGNAKLLKKFYENKLSKSINGIISPLVSSYSSANGKIYLSWNDSTEKVSFPNVLTDGIYNFQGYNIYQINSHSLNPKKEDTVLIKTFDLKDGIGNIYDSLYLEEYNGIIYALVQKGSNTGISRYIEITRDTISNKPFVNGTEYKFAVTAYYYDPSGGLYSLPKVLETKKEIIIVVPQNINAVVQTSYNFGDTLFTDQKDNVVMPVVIDPLKLISASYTSTFGGTNENTNWTLTRTANGITTTLFQNVPDFKGQQDTVLIADGLQFVHLENKDSGVVKDPYDRYYFNNFSENNTRQKGWTYEPEGKEWFEGPDSSSIATAKVLNGRMFQSRSLGMSFPTNGTFKNQRSRIRANGKYFEAQGNSVLSGGPLRKIQFVFGENSLAYRYIPADTNLISTPFKDLVTIPFSVYAIDELDSSSGTPRKLNVAFVDYDESTTWNPDTSSLGGYEFTFIFASDYTEIPNAEYTSRNIMLGSPATGFPAFDVMYVWLPRVKSVNGVPQIWNNGDKLTVYPYRITRPDFVPGYPVKYSWTVNGTSFNNAANAMAEVQNIKVFPNPYYGFSELEYNDAGEKFIYFSHLPARCDIFVYTLDGVLAKKIERNTNDPNNTLEKWDLKNNSGSYVASGMYIVLVDCKDLGSKIVKIAVFQNKF